MTTNKNIPLENLNIFSIKGIQMRTFHITWLTFFACFFAWFAMAPLMKIAKEQLGLTKDQIGNIQIGAHIAAFIVSFLISFTYCFIMNKFIVFTTSELRGRVQLFRYGLTVISCIGLNYLFLKLFVEAFGWYATPSKALTTALVAVYSYFTQQYFQGLCLYPAWRK